MAETTVPADRQQVALDASTRLEALLNMLRRERGHNNDDRELELVLDDTLQRASELAQVVSLALIGGEGIPIEDLRRAVHGNQTGEAANV